MQIIDWILIIIAVIALAVVVFFISRRWKKLLLLDVAAMPKAKIHSQKYKIIEERLQRKTKAVIFGAKKIFRPAQGGTNDFFTHWHGKLKQLESKYKNVRATPKNQEEKEQTRQKIAQLMDKGMQFCKSNNYVEAENVFVDIVRLDPKNAEAYEYLGEIYLHKKEYDHACESLEFAKKIDPKNDRIYYALGQVYQERGSMEEAKDCFKQSVELAPKSPRNISAQLELAFMMKDRLTARQALNQLKEANPENQKIAEFEQRIAQI
ncbi:MAG: hypothetical protein A2233_01530 [Candidatus Kerfeldbacteria bacterium RIFOXYA2_FULL_38_24]|uniref:Uncharacterized protein n=1 Tax=Candidatus Kerfeldbacteria bacterium RIFOXYB2_FULL_38_14 TaxID=1798547 RepID=A0A1G2BFU5_9BACT|nr:MAG: hypothetical protein A2233_01530 [Candidatus Kerfeldbacteria bacterium RIFOXYA2_FULL_38_24]OGY87150.1 MAG: hypothetical protein A2319_02660 [Candidatus Kerfeldbacteria bacterium RIFOXYB2_FULL_38_14]OGY88560.1 MAG: hypothetical protein A2458_02050 [Candidatus Kerfeldbacteria bacterium RIFOXYC2_FULL_38_9]